MTSQPEGPSIDYQTARSLVEEKSILHLENGTLVWEGLDGLLDQLDKSYIKHASISGVKLIQLADLEDILGSLVQSKHLLSSLALKGLDLRGATGVISVLLDIVTSTYLGRRPQRHLVA